MARKTLNEMIAAKAIALRGKQAEKAQAAEGLITASQAAARESTEAARQASAAEEAFRMLDDAGVTL